MVRQNLSASPLYPTLIEIEWAGKAGMSRIEKELIRAGEFVIVEKIRLVCLLELTADFGVNTYVKLTPNC